MNSLHCPLDPGLENAASVNDHCRRASRGYSYYPSSSFLCLFLIGHLLVQTIGLPNNNIKAYILDSPP